MQEKLRLLFVLDHFGGGGAQRQMVNLAVELAARHEIEFFTYHPSFGHFADPVESAAIPVHTVPKEHRGSIGVIRALRRLVRNGAYDGILAFLGTPNQFAELACVGIARPALVVSERSAWLDRLTLRARMQQPFHRLADRIVTNSHSQRERMVREYGWMADRITTIGNGVDLDAFTATPVPTDPQLQLLTLARVGAEKNALRIVEALRLYREWYGQPPVLRWAGREDESRAGRSYIAEVRRRISEHGLEPQIEWLGERSDTSELLRTHHGLLHGSLFEGMPNAVCEAFAAGRPALVSDVCDHPRIVEEGVTGLLFDPLDAGAIAKALHRFALLTPAERQAMGTQARRYAERNLSMSGAAEQYERLFAELISRRRNGSER